MSFKFTPPNIHQVSNVTAEVMEIRNRKDGEDFARMQLTIHGSGSQSEDVDLYFPADSIHRAHAIADAINAATDADITIAAE